MVVNRSREIWKTYGNVFDSFTLKNLEKLSTYFVELKSEVAPGKEANVFTAITEDNRLVIVKIYRLENCNFNKMYTYISQDPRYVDLKGQRRKIIFAWTQREYRNLMKAREVIRVPTPITFKDNILVMEYIDEDDKPAKPLKNVHLEKPEQFFNDIIEMIKKLYKGGLVHGDLSEFNILVKNNKPVFIDFSQGTTIDSQNTEELLVRDVENICRYFKKLGLKKDPLEVLASPTFKKRL